jgi:hypothetical protein
MKDLTLDIELCAYMLAIVLERHIVTAVTWNDVSGHSALTSLLAT